MMTATNTRKEARQSLAGKWGKGALITLAYFVFSFVLGFIEGMFEENSTLYYIISIVVLIIDIPISFGLVISFIKLKRGEDVGAFDFLTNGFANFKRAWGIAWNTFVKMIIPFIVLVVATIIFVFCGAASIINSLQGTVSTISTVSTESSSALLLIGTIIFIAATIFVTVKSLLYSLSDYIAYDNSEMSTKDAVNESEKLMKGNRGNLFVLELSFIGWAILAAFTFGIGMFWLAPYMQVALVCFYEELINKNN